MSTCSDVYVLPADGCGVVWTYPSDIHRCPDCGGFECKCALPRPLRVQPISPYFEPPKQRTEDDELALILMGLL